MKVNWMKVIFLALAVSLGIVSGYKAMAQTTSPGSINSTQDYIHIRESINTLSQQLFALYQKHPSCTFSPEYNDEGRLVVMHVNGVSNAAEAQQISRCLMDLESLGNLVRNMNEEYLPVTFEDAEKSRLNEQDSEAYFPVVKTGEGLISSTKK
ncbi:MAG TPA: hypothetical protein VGK59_13335 [Ohtaekwangia sp.]